jgi:hypothetical protein
MGWEKRLFRFLMDIGVSFPDDQRVRRLLDCWNARPVALLGKQFGRKDFGYEADEIAQGRAHRAALHLASDKGSPHSVDCRGAVSIKLAYEPTEGEWPLVMAIGVEGYSAKVAATKSLFSGLLFVPATVCRSPDRRDDSIHVNNPVFVQNTVALCGDHFG